MTGSGRQTGRGAPGADAPNEALILPFRVLAVTAAQLFDFATFTIMVERHGIAAEVNPLVAHSFLGFGMPMVALLKVLLIVLLGSIIVVLDPRNRPAGRFARGIAAAIAVLAVVAGLFGGISNVRAF